MSDKRVIRINKVLRELNISLDRAVDFLKEKDHEIEASPNAKISQEEYDVLCSQFSADKGKKVASLEVSEEKKKEKEALKKELEKEVELKRQQDELQKQEVIKARAILTGPKAIGKIDLNPKKIEPKVVEQVAEKPEVVAAEIKNEKPEVVVSQEDKTTKETPKVEITKPKVELQEKKENVQEPIVPEQVVQEKTGEEQTEEDKIATNYQKLSGTTFTGQKIDLSQFNKPKKKIEPRKDIKKAPDNKPANANNKNNNDPNKNKRKRITKPVPGGGTPNAQNNTGE